MEINIFQIVNLINQESNHLLIIKIIENFKIF